MSEELKTHQIRHDGQEATRFFMREVTVDEVHGSRRAHVYGRDMFELISTVKPGDSEEDPYFDSPYDCRFGGGEIDEQRWLEHGEVVRIGDKGWWE